MDEIADLIRLLAERPASEPPLSRPKELLEQRSIERAIQTEPLSLDKQTEAALPAIKAQSQEAPAVVARPEQSEGPLPQLQPKAVGQEEQADPARPTADTGLPSVVAQNLQSTHVPAGAMPALRFIGKAATPSLLQAYRGAPAEARSKGPITVEANVSPAVKVQMVIPPALPFDPEAMFNQGDEAFRVPQTSSPQVRRLGTSLPLFLQSSEQLVADRFFAVDGERHSLERFSL